MPYETRLRKVSETDVNSANNTSKVTIAFDFRRTDYTYTGYNMEGNAYYTITCAGQSSGKVYFTFDWTVAQNEWKEIGRKTFTVTHNADGSKTAAISGYWYTGIAPAELSASDSITLTTIPRATTPTLSASSVAAGGSVTINTPRASSSFTHTLTYSFGTKSGTIASSVGTSYAWTVPLSILTGIPNTTSGTCTITCKTYNGSTLIGTKTVTLKITAPSSVVPTISSVAIAEAVTSVKTKFGAYVQNKSKLTVKTTAAGAQGSTISSCKVTVNGVTYTGTNITTGVITISGSVSVKATVTDSRGRTATKTETITVLEYFNPTILAFSGVRCTDTGEEDDEGTGLKLDRKSVV